MRRLMVYFRRTAENCARNDVQMLARAAAYSAILCVFPISLIVAAVLASTPSAPFVKAELTGMLNQMFPPDVPPLVLSYFQQQHRSFRLILSSAVVILLASNSVMTTLMEAMRRAYRLPENGWSVGRQIFIAFILTFLSFVPLALASVFVVFGHQIEMWMNYQSSYDLRPLVLIMARLVRWVLALLTSVTVLTIIYHIGTPRTQSWRRVLPGSILGTALWFASTLAFGWYVTRHAHYKQVYGSLGAGVALLIWLYIVLISVIIGAEFNAAVYPKPD